MKRPKRTVPKKFSKFTKSAPSYPRTLSWWWGPSCSNPTPNLWWTSPPPSYRRRERLSWRFLKNILKNFRFKKKFSSHLYLRVVTSKFSLSLRRQVIVPCSSPRLCSMRTCSLWGNKMYCKTLIYLGRTVQPPMSTLGLIISTAQKMGKILNFLTQRIETIVFVISSTWRAFSTQFCLTSVECGIAYSVVRSLNFGSARSGFW